MKTSGIYEKSQATKRIESSQLAQDGGEDLEKSIQEALEEANAIGAENNASLNQENKDLKEHERELAVVEEALVRWKKAMETKNRWDKGNVAQGLIAEHLLRHRQKKYEEEYKTLRESFNRKWNGK